MRAGRKASSKEALEWYLHFNACFSNFIFDHKDEEDQQKTVRRLAKYCDDWEGMSFPLPWKIQAESALDMFSECIQAYERRLDRFDGFGQLAERCTSLFIGRAGMLNRNEKRMLALRVAAMFDGHFGSPMFERMLTELVGPTDIGDVLDRIRKDIFYRFRDSNDTVMEAVDCQYRELAERLIDAAGRSGRGNLKDKLTIRIC